MEEIEASFQATKDMDVILIVETLDSFFGETFWKFIEDGGYKHLEKSTDEKYFYRFTTPKDSAFPKMIVFFSKQHGNLDQILLTG